MDWAGAVFGIAMAALFVGLWVFALTRARTILKRWANSNGYRIVEQQRRHLRRGPFFWTTGKGQVVYRIVAESLDGQIRHGYVRCGGIFLGVLSDHAEVRWDKEATYQPGFPVVLPPEDQKR
jgi:hypothetical protein